MQRPKIEQHLPDTPNVCDFLQVGHKEGPMRHQKAPRDIEDTIEMIPFVILLCVLFVGLCVTYFR